MVNDGGLLIGGLGDSHPLMSLFDFYIMVDWSGAALARRGRAAGVRLLVTDAVGLAYLYWHAEERTGIAVDWLSH